MKQALMILTGGLTLTMCIAVGQGQELRHGTLSGTIVSATAQVPFCELDPDGSSMTCPEVNLYAPPAGRMFVLTQACGQLVTGKMTGVIAGSGNFCTTYEPGIAVPAGETLKCKSNTCCGGAATQPCTITGVLTREKN